MLPITQQEFGMPTETVEEVLRQGKIEILGRVTNSSNVTLFTQVTHQDVQLHAIYKPLKGERPLHDFPPGLYKREIATYELTRQIGWEIVPPTVLYRHEQYGEGSLQAFIDADFSINYFTMKETNTKIQELKKLCAMDFIINNADRKGSHCLLSTQGNLYGIDHGLCFHEQDKLRTVMWDFTNEPIPKEIQDDIKKIISQAEHTPAATYLTAEELEKLLYRTEMFCKQETFPEDDTGGRKWPWPPL